MTSEGTARGRFARAIRERQLRNAEDAARELERLSLDDALQLVQLYADAGSPKYERAALRWLGRYIEESEPSLEDVAGTASAFVERRSRSG